MSEPACWNSTHWSQFRLPWTGESRTCTWPRSTAPFRGHSGWLAARGPPRGSWRHSIPVQEPAARAHTHSLRIVLHTRNSNGQEEGGSWCSTLTVLHDKGLELARLAHSVLRPTARVVARTKILGPQFSFVTRRRCTPRASPAAGTSVKDGWECRRPRVRGMRTKYAAWTFQPSSSAPSRTRSLP